MLIMRINFSIAIYNYFKAKLIVTINFVYIHLPSLDGVGRSGLGTAMAGGGNGTLAIS